MNAVADDSISRGRERLEVNYFVFFFNTHDSKRIQTEVRGVEVVK
jgi:hypothetical protein